MVGLDKTELIHRRGPWRSLDQLELATAEWIDWWNQRRLTVRPAMPHLPSSRSSTIAIARPARSPESKPPSLHESQGSSLLLHARTVDAGDPFVSVDHLREVTVLLLLPLVDLADGRRYQDRPSSTDTAIRRALKRLGLLDGLCRRISVSPASEVRMP